MKRLMKGIIALSVLGLLSDNAEAVTEITIDVTPAFAPHGPISPSWNSYVDNAISALAVGSPSDGDRDVSPNAYEAVAGPITPFELIRTPFNSWRGSASPSATFTSLPPAFQLENGNRIHFGLRIATNGELEFALQDLSFELDSDDITNFFDQDGNFSAGNYSPARVGIHYGPDGSPGGDDDVIYDDGESGAITVNELLYVGIGDSFLSDEPGDLPDNDDIDETLRSLLCDAGCSFNLTGIYSLNDPMGGDPIIGTGSVEVVIEPGYGGDFNRDHQVDCGDLDLLTQEINAGTNDILYDMDSNGLVEFEDLRITVQDVLNTWFGDANCDQEFNSNDLISVFVTGLYDSEVEGLAKWSTGDWNGDGNFDSIDLVIAFQDGGYDAGPKPAASAELSVVPEPSTALLTLIGFFGLFAYRRRSS